VRLANTGEFLIKLSGQDAALLGNRQKVVIGWDAKDALALADRT
jgi:hypothetical protein